MSFLPKNLPRTLLYVAGALCFLLQIASSRAATQYIYVNQNGPNGNGTTWASPYRELRDALTDSKINFATEANPVEIWVAKGVYAPTANTNPDATFTVRSHVRIIGGFAGGELTDRNRKFDNMAVLTGDIGVKQATAVTPRNAFSAPPEVNIDDPAFQDNSANVVTIKDATDVILNMLVIAGGCASKYGTNTDMSIESMGMASVEDSNPAENTGAMVKLWNGVAGGGLYFENVYPTATKAGLIVDHCVFVNNYAAGYGGAIAGKGGAAIQVTESTFNNNAAIWAGGAFWGLDVNANFYHCDFNGNTAAQSGGALSFNAFGETRPPVPALNAPPVQLGLNPGKDPQDRQGMNLKDLNKVRKYAINSFELGEKIYNSLTIKSAVKRTFMEKVETFAGNRWNFAAKEISVGARAARAYNVISDIIAAVDVGMQVAEWFGADEDNDFCRGWKTFSDGFNTYATPEGLSMLVSSKLIEVIIADGEKHNTAKQIITMKNYQLQIFNQDDYSTVIACAFDKNTAGNSGGAISIIHENVQIENCTFTRNSADVDGGAIRSMAWTTPIIVSSVFDGNRSISGNSVVYNVGHSRMQMVNCTVINNVSESNQGYAIANTMGSDVKIFNSILWSNKNSDPANAQGGADIFTATYDMYLADPTTATNLTDNPTAYLDFAGICDISHSIVQSLAQLPLGTDSIPMFNDAFHDAKHDDKHPPTQAEIEGVLHNYDVADAAGTLEMYGFINIGWGNRPGIRDTAKANSDDNPLLIGSKISSASPAVDHGSNLLLNNGEISSYTGVDVDDQNRFFGPSIDIGASEVQAHRTVMFVKQDARGNNTGTDWDNAFTNLQSALLIPNVDLWVAGGTYYPTGGLDRNASFTITNGVHVYGGFGGSEASVNQRNWVTRPSILSGNIGVRANDDDNSFCILNARFVTNVVMDGFTFTKGRGSAGSALSVLEAEMGVTNCRFVDNQSQGAGGAVRAVGSLAVKFTTCEFTNNTAFSGGALYANAPVTVWNSVIQGNSAHWGGAMLFDHGLPSAIVGGLFVSNSVTQAIDKSGGAIASANTDVAVYNSTFVQNTVTGATGGQGGGAISFNGTGFTLMAQNSIFWNNSVSGSAASVEAQQIGAGAGTVAQVTYDLIQGLSGFGATANKNLGVDPFFVDADSGNYRLTAFSPAVNTGKNNIGSGYPSVDLDRKSRLQSTDMDMGAYEFVGDPKTISTVVVASACNRLSLLTSGPFNHFQWQYDDGSGFQNCIDGNFQGVRTPELTIYAQPSSIDGWKFRVVDPFGLISDSFTFRDSSRLYVNAAIGASGNGKSWATAFKTLDEAFNAVGLCAEIWVATGIYEPTGSSADDAYRLRKNVAVYGGFNGTEYDISQRSALTNLTMIQGRRSSGIDVRNVFLNDASLPGATIDGSAIVDGFTIVGGSSAPILNRNASPLFQDCVLISNDGEIVRNDATSAPTFTGCTFARMLQAICNSDAGAYFTVTSAQTTQWEVNRGGIFMPIATDPSYAGLLDISVANGISTLSLSTIAVPGDTFRFKLIENGYKSPAVQIYAAGSTIGFVDSRATGANDGSSWANAYTSLHDAVALASACTELWVAQGTYMPNTNRAQTFSLRTGVAIYGGFAGGESSRGARNTTNHPTLLKGIGDNYVFWNVGTTVGIDSSAILDGFIFTNLPPRNVILNRHAGPTIQNCVFAGNAGNAIYNVDSQTRVFGCTFTDNANTAIFSLSSSIEVGGSRFERNRSRFYGGGVFLQDSNARIVNSEFRNNSASRGAGVYAVGKSAVTISGSRFIGNTADDEGGAVFVGLGAQGAVVNSLLSLNSSHWRGAGISHYGTQLDVIQSTVVDNSDSYGGAGLSVQYSTSSARVVNSIFWGNRIVADPAKLELGQIETAQGSVSVISSTVQGLQTLTQSSSDAYDPIFANPATGDYHLTSFSPAINTGGSIPNGGAFDLEEHGRIFGSAADRGAYEYQFPQTQVVKFKSLPRSIAVCSETEMNFTVVGAPSESYVFEWERYDGTRSGFFPVSGAAYDISTVNNTSVLRIAIPTLAMNGDRFHLRVGNFVSPELRLTVTAPTILYVNKNGSGADGLSWAGGFKRIEAAVAVADECTEIWVKQGTYALTNSLQMKPGVRLYGGFDGSETNRSQRNVVANESILKTQGAPAIVNADFRVNVDRSSVLDGFVFRGNDDVSIVNFTASPTIRNCVFDANKAASIRNGYRSAPLIDSCIFEKGLATAVVSDGSSPTISNCQFLNNASSAHGGALYSSGGTTTISASQFINNTSEQNGGGVYLLWANTTITRSTFDGNSALHGGGLCAWFGSLNVDNSLFHANSTPEEGAGIYLESATARVVNCTVAVNQSGHAPGAGVYQRDGDVTIANSILWNNLSTYPYVSDEGWQFFATSGATSIQSTAIQGLSAYQGNNNLAFDPLFLDPDAGNFHLDLASPLIDAGNNSLAAVSGIDLAGQARTNVSVPVHTVDLGVFEEHYPATTPLILYKQASSQTVCEGTTATFEVRGSPGQGQYVQWQISVDGGATFNGLPPGNSHVIIVNDGNSSLVISNAPLSMNGNVYRYDHGLVAYRSPQFTLQVHSRDRIYVNASATGGETGADWANAYKTLDSALNAAGSCNDIWVAKGTYVPSGWFALQNGVRILGGFGGWETSEGQRNPGANETILLGNGTAPAVQNLQWQSVDRTALLDGFTIRGGDADFAMEFTAGSPTIRSCKFDGSNSYSVYLQAASPLFDSCVFSNNHDTPVLNYFSSAATYTNCLFFGNAGGSAGAMLNNSSSPTIDHCVFDSNASRTDGGAILEMGASSTFVYCIFRNNSADFDAGAGSFQNSSSAILNSLVYGNRARSVAAFAFISSTVRMVNSTIADNAADRSVGGISVLGGTNQIQNSIVWNNRDQTGTGIDSEIYYPGGVATVLNSVVEGWVGSSGGNAGFAPLFIDPLTHDYHIDHFDSPAVGLGDNTFAAGLDTDLDGNQRVILTVDAGAYESRGVPGTSVRLLTIPQSTSACADDTGLFTVVADPSAGSTFFIWDYNDGAGWRSFTPHADGTAGGPALGSFTLVRNALDSTLGVSSISPGLDGLLIRVNAGGVMPAPVRLSVTPLGVIFVNAAAAPGGNGNSWTTAYDSLQTAIDNITSCRREVWIAEGSYTPPATNTTGFSIPPKTEIYGGFAGNETARSQRDWNLHPSVIQGNALGDRDGLTLFENDIADNHTIFDGVTVENAGIGLYVVGSSPVIRNCVFRNNEQALVLSQSNARISNCGFEGNTNGAVQISQSAPTILDSTFTGNSGRAAIFVSQSSPQIINTLVAGNRDEGIRFASATGAFMLNCTIAHNFNGGVILQSSGADLLVRNSILWGNRWTNAPSMEASQIRQAAGANAEVHDTIIEGLSSFAGNVNRDTDPLFVGPVLAASAPISAGDYSLQSCSPAIDAGNLTSVTETTDLLGNPRIYPPYLDIGAYEFQGVAHNGLQILSASPSIVFCATGTNSFGVRALGEGLSYQWEMDAGNGIGFVPISNGAVFAGVTSTNLFVKLRDENLNGAQFRCIVSSSTGCHLASAAAMLTVNPARWFVNQNAAPGGDGTSWATAFTSLRAALENPALGACGSEIWVAQGAYHEAASSSLHMVANVAVYGGFVGGETSLSARDWIAHPTILDGDNHVIFFNQATTQLTETTIIDTPIDGAVLDGFTLQNANAGIVLSNGKNFHFTQVGANPTIANCVFKNCQTGISITDSSPVVERCAFLNNDYGVTSDTSVDSDFDSHPVFDRCRFQANRIYAIHALDTLLDVSNSLVSGNSTVGAALWVYGRTTTLWNCTVAGNNGIGLKLDHASADIYNCIFWHNRAGGYPLLIDQQINQNFATAHASGTIIEGLQSPNSLLNGNFAFDPQFVLGLDASAAPTTSGDYHLSTCSPAVNAGDNSQSFRVVDLDGEARVASVAVDLGAFEFGGPVLRILTQPSDQTGSFSTPAQFAVTVNLSGATFQWQENDADLVDDLQHSGSHSATLTIARTAAYFDLRTFRCRVTGPNGCTVYSTEAIYHFNDVSPTFALRNSNAVSPWGPINLSFGQNVDSASVNAGTFFVNGMQSGAVPAANTIVTAGAIEFDPTWPLLPGEKVYVTATDGILSTSGYAARPFVSEFRVRVPRAGVGEYVVGDAIPFASNDVALGDFDGDGRVDLFFATDFGGVAAFNNGAGGGPVNATAMQLVRLGDLNGDGWVDVAFLRNDGTVGILFNDGGFFTESTQIIGTNVHSIAIGDLDGDGTLDLALAGDGPTQVWFNNGAGGFGDSTLRLGSGAASIEVGDLNNDGALELIVAGQTNRVWMNNGIGGFTQLSQALGTNGLRIAVGDLNSDGSLDVAIVSTNAPTKIWRNNGGASFTASSIGTAAKAIALADMNADGRLDLWIAQMDGVLRLWTNQGPATFVASAPIATGDFNSIVYGDIDQNGSLDLLVNEQNSALAIFNNDAATDEDVPVAIPASTFTDTFSVYDDSPLATVEFVSGPYQGEFTLGGAPIDPGQAILASELATLVYVPYTNSFGSDFVAWRGVAENGDVVDELGLGIVVHAIDDAPEAARDAILVWKDDSATQLTSGASSVLANDTDVDDATLTASIFAGPFNGTMTMNADGTFAYTNIGGGPVGDTVFYHVTDSGGAVSEGIIGISVVDLPQTRALKDALAGTPVGRFEVHEAVAVPIAYNYALVSGAGDDDNASFSISGDFLLSAVSLDFASQPNYRIRVQISDGGYGVAEKAFVITPESIPVVTDQYITIDEDQSIAVTLSATDADNDTLTYSLVTPPSHGALTGTFPNMTYLPDTNYFGTDFLVFKVNDGMFDSATATIVFTVRSVNDLPIAFGQTLTTDEDTALPITLAGFDVESPLTFSVTSGPNHGVLTGTIPDFTYTPDPNFHGADSITFVVNDGTTDSAPATIDITVNSINDGPVANSSTYYTSVHTPFTIPFDVSDADNDPLTILGFGVIDVAQHGAIVYSYGDYQFWPDAHYHGTDSFSFYASDGTANSGIATFTIVMTNRPPTASVQNVGVYKNVAKYFALGASDPDDDPITVTYTSTPTLGALTGPPDALVYTPNLDVTGTDIITYDVDDGYGGHTSGVLEMHVQPAVITVTSTADSGPGTLRAAIDLAISDPVVQRTIKFDSNLTGQTIALTTADDHVVGDSAFGIGCDVIIDGSDAPGLHIARDFNFGEMRIFRVSQFCKLTMSDLTLEMGYSIYGGGAIYCEGTLDIAKVHFADNLAAGGSYGGAILGRNATIFLYATFSGNSASQAADVYLLGDGGAAYMELEGTPFTSNMLVDAINGGGAGYFPPSNFTGYVQHGGGSANISIIPPGSLHQVSAVDQPSHGSTTFDATSVTYAHDGGSSGTDSFTFTITGPHGGEMVSSASITIDDLHYPIPAANDTASVFDQGEVTVQVLDNDTPLNVLPLTVVGASTAQYGTVTTTSGNVKYRHTGSGLSDTFQYYIEDGNGGRGTGTVSITVVLPLIVVTNAADSGPGTLREAINTARTQSQLGGQQWTIKFAPALAGQTILLSTADDNTWRASAFAADFDLTIDAVDAPGLVLARDTSGPKMRFFRVDNRLVLKNIALRDGYSVEASFGDGGAAGGAIWSSSVVELTNVTISNCKAQGTFFSRGGAIYNQEGVANLTDVTLSANSLQSNPGFATDGAAIYCLNGGLNVKHLSAVNNVAPNGAAVYLLALNGQFAGASLELCAFDNPSATRDLDAQAHGTGSATIFADDNTYRKAPTPSVQQIPDQFVHDTVSLPITTTAPVNGGTFSVTAMPTPFFDQNGPHVVVNCNAVVLGSGTNRTLTLSPIFPETQQGRVGVFVQDDNVTYVEQFYVTLDRSANGVNRFSAPEQMWGPGTTIDWDVDDALGAAGASPGWDLIDLTGGLEIAASSVKPITVRTQTAGGSAAHFDRTQSYSWPFVATQTDVSNFATASFVVDPANFGNDLAGGTFSITNTPAHGLSIVFTPNRAPQTTLRSITRAPGTTLKIRISDLLANNTSDPDGDGRILVSIAAQSANGKSLRTDSAFIYYESDDDLDDTFTYTIKDDKTVRVGDTTQTATGSISIHVGDVYTQSSIVSLTQLAAGANRLVFAGIPGRQCVLQAADNPAGPWADIANGSVGSDGRWTADDNNATAPQRYYRVRTF